MLELIKEYYLISVLCGGVCLMFTCVGGWLLLKGMNVLAEDIKSDETQ